MTPNGTTFRVGRNTYEVTAYVPSRPQYPYTAKRLPDGKLFRFPVNVVEGTNQVVTPTAAGIPAIGTVFTSRGTEYRVTGYTPSRYKFPVSAVRVRDGAPFKFTVAACGVTTTPSSSTTPTTKPTLRVGDRVEFTCTKRGKPPVISGTVKSINARTVTLTDTSDGHPVGWRVTPESLRPSTHSVPAPVKQVPPVTVRVGQTVTVTAATWASGFKPTTVTGVVTLVDASKGEVEVYSAATRSRRFPANEVTAAPKRDDASLVKEAGAVYAALSPENLTCDGELSRGQVAVAYATLQRALRALQAEAGRTITESETYRVTA